MPRSRRPTPTDAALIDRLRGELDDVLPPKATNEVVIYFACLAIQLLTIARNSSLDEAALRIEAEAARHENKKRLALLRVAELVRAAKGSSPR